jgi:TRAP-type C4-dicarboxylate transport system permease small subunit
MEQIYSIIDRLVAVLLLVLVGLVLFIILSRQIGVSWVWLYDLARWSLIWLVFLGAIPLTGRAGHLSIEVAAERLSAPLRYGGQALAAIASAGVAGLVAYHGGLEVLRMHEFGERSMSGRLPAALGYAILPLGFALLVLASLDALRRAAARLLSRS